MSEKNCAALHDDEVGRVRGNVGKRRQNAANVPAAEKKKAKRRERKVREASGLSMRRRRRSRPSSKNQFNRRGAGRREKQLLAFSAPPQ